MSKEETFYKTILAQATKGADALLEHPEVRSVAVVIDWNLPTAAAAALPVGVLSQNTENKSDYVETLQSLQTQTVKMSAVIGHNILTNMCDMYAQIKKQAEIGTVPKNG